MFEGGEVQERTVESKRNLGVVNFGDYLGQMYSEEQICQ